jgi:hypothetical protein
MEKENPELLRLKSSNGNKQWKQWGPYLSERQWGTVREDYSANGDAWNYLSHDKARSKAYRWGEDGIAGISDSEQNLCFSLALWNGKDPILKERLFGLTNNEGNHGEDVKELYYYLDSTPTHSYMKMLYKYPIEEFPYKELVEENKKRGYKDREFEIHDTKIFKSNKFSDVYIEYAKESEEDILIKITVHNTTNKKASLHIIPTLWFRNTWRWSNEPIPQIKRNEDHLKITHKTMGNYHLYFEGNPEIVFCENETNYEKLYNTPNLTATVKDGINDYLITGDKISINSKPQGTKTGIIYKIDLKKNEQVTFQLRLSKKKLKLPFEDFGKIFNARIKEANLFYDKMHPEVQDKELKMIQRQAYAGLLWTKQFYYYDLFRWLQGDPNSPPPPSERKNGRNAHWKHLVNKHIISIPDKWEFPWYAAWDLAFHCVPLARLDSDFAKEQILLMLRDDYMHPNGQMPAYEWHFSDVNPPVHAWGALKVYQIDHELNGKADKEFLELVLHKLLMNFTWWVNQRDEWGNNIFEGGFLGLDNIGVFDRGKILPSGHLLEQADGTAWMGMYCLNMMKISLELAKERPSYQDLAFKFVVHFLNIAGSMVNIGGEGKSLWDDEDHFYYDILHLPGQSSQLLKVRSMVGLIPMFAVEVLEPQFIDQFPIFKRKLETYLEYRSDLNQLISRWKEPGEGDTHLFSLLRGFRLKKILKRMLDDNEFLSSYGIRSLSKYHLEKPFSIQIENENHTVTYNPGESDNGIFGGNSNWRGPIWFPVNFLIIDSLLNFYKYFGKDFQVEHPVGSGTYKNLEQIAIDLSERLISIFKADNNGRRAYNGESFHNSAHAESQDKLLFYEYFNGESGEGHGASHQTGWTALIAEIITTLVKHPIDKSSRKDKIEVNI